MLSYERGWNILKCQGVEGTQREKEKAQDWQMSERETPAAGLALGQSSCPVELSAHGETQGPLDVSHRALTQTTGSHHIRGTRELQAARSKPPKPLDPSPLGCPIWAWPPHPHCQPHQPVPSSFLTAPALGECPPPTSVCTCSQAAVGRGERRVEALTAPPHLLPAVSRPGGSPSQRGKGALTQTGPHSGGLHVSSP